MWHYFDFLIFVLHFTTIPVKRQIHHSDILRAVDGDPQKMMMSEDQCVMFVTPVVFTNTTREKLKNIPIDGQLI